jgi:hypothetical protein
METAPECIVVAVAFGLAVDDGAAVVAAVSVVAVAVDPTANQDQKMCDLKQFTYCTVLFNYIKMGFIARCCLHILLVKIGSSNKIAKLSNQIFNWREHCLLVNKLLFTHGPHVAPSFY